METQTALQFAEIGLLVSEVKSVTIKAGAILLLLALVHAGISIKWKNVHGVTSIVIPVRSAVLLLAGVWLLGFGLSLA